MAAEDRDVPRLATDPIPGGVAQAEPLSPAGPGPRQTLPPAEESPEISHRSTTRHAVDEPDGELASGIERRIVHHPVLTEPLSPACVPFTFDGRPLQAREGEVITSALYAAGTTVLGRHPQDSGPQGIFCANGQCSRCLVLADGRPVKGCMAEVRPGMVVRSLQGVHPPLPADDRAPGYGAAEVVRAEVLVVGGGPAGIAAAIELGQAGVDTLLVDDKAELGGKLTLQTHQFFGSVKDCWAGTRGIEIGRKLEQELAHLPGVRVWRSAVCLGAFADGRVGVLRQGRRSEYRLVVPRLLLVAAGAREKALVFPGNDLPGVYGAGAFQTLVNRDRVLAARRLFVLGGGNVGLIGAYHALQAGIRVVGLVEALPQCGGYAVHEDKIRRLGVPIWTGHTVVRAHGDDVLRSVTIAALDERLRPRAGSERSFAVDTLLLAVGLSPVDELAVQAEANGIPVLRAGDAEEIAEASAAIFSGRLAGRRAAARLGRPIELPAEWTRLVEVMKSRPGPRQPLAVPEPPAESAAVPVLRCSQSIPCDPCVEACPHGLIGKAGGILDLPLFSGNCTGCARCVIACPGLAVVLVHQDHDPRQRMARLVLPYELLEETLPPNGEVTTVGAGGEVVGKGRVLAVRRRRARDRRRLIELEVPWAERLQVAGFRLWEPEKGRTEGAGEGAREGELEEERAREAEDALVCQCERVRRSKIRAAISDGVRDMNQLKAITRAGMGACAGKTCRELILRLFREQGVSPTEVVLPTARPLVAETPLAVFAGVLEDLPAGEGEGR